MIGSRTCPIHHTCPIRETKIAFYSPKRWCTTHTRRGRRRHSRLTPWLCKRRITWKSLLRLSLRFGKSPSLLVLFCLSFCSEQIFVLFSVYFVNNKYPGYERMVIRWCVTLLNMLHNERKWELYLPRETDEKDDHVLKLLDNSIVSYLESMKWNRFFVSLKDAMNCLEKFYEMVMAKQCFESLKVYSLKEKSHIPMAAVDPRTKELLEIRKVLIDIFITAQF